MPFRFVWLLALTAMFRTGSAADGQAQGAVPVLPEPPPKPAEDALSPSWMDASRMDVVENFRVPLEKHANGRVKTLLHAGRATMSAKGAVEAEKVRIELYDTAGVMTGVIRAEKASVDQVNRSGTGSGPVQMERRDVTIGGVGLTWDGSENVVRIESEAFVELDRSGKTLVEGWR